MNATDPTENGNRQASGSATEVDAARRDEIRANVARAHMEIAEAASSVGRNPSEIRLLPVTKFQPSSDIRILYDLGFSDFAENRVQELRQKSIDLEGLGVNWVLIGHLQSNKSGQVARLASEVESVDSLRIAEALNSARNRLAENAENQAAPPLRVLLQVNTSGEPSKYGMTPAQTPAVLEQALDLPHLEVAGLMTMAPLTSEESVVRYTFARLLQTRDQLQPHFPQSSLRELSMGMSHDFRIAIEEGATTIRLGTALLGPRT